MKVIELREPGSPAGLVLAHRPRRMPGSGEIEVRIEAASLNFHDHAVIAGALPVATGRIPLSDAAGVVSAVGPEVSAFREGDAVMSTFFPAWMDGPVSRGVLACVPGEHVDGFAAEYVCAPARAFTRVPAAYSMAEAATLPCAALTAWRALFVENTLRPGDYVLVQGTGGVSLFALQFALAAGARVIATSASGEKRQKLRALGAEHVIDYASEKDWGDLVRQRSGGEGVDIVVEVGGPGTLAQSIASTRVGGSIVLIGVLTGWSGEVPTAALMGKNIRLTGMTVGSVAHQQLMLRSLEAMPARPVIDRCFPLHDISDAFRFMAAQKHFGKIGLLFD